MSLPTSEQLFKSLMAALMAIAFTIVGSGAAWAQPYTVRYREGGPPIPVSTNLNFSGGLEYGDGELRFSLSNGTPNDQLNLTSAADPTAQGAIFVDSSGSIFLGNGSGSNRIGSIAKSENGTNGTGGGTGTGSIIVSTPSGAVGYTVSINSQTVGSGNYALRLVSSGNITSPSGSDRPTGNGSLHGPYVRSDSFQAFAGDRITLDFSAQQGSDAYEVFGFLIGAGSDNLLGTGDDSRTQLFAKRGDRIPFNSVSATIPADGQYQFEFVCGTYDKTGGLALGASLFVDNVRLVSATSISDAVVQAIADRVTYSNTSKNPNPETRHLNITRKTANNVTDSAAVDILFSAVNDAPAIATNVGVTVKEGGWVTIGSDNLSAIDPDNSSADLTYTLTGEPSYGILQVSGVYTTRFTQADLDAGRVTYIHDGSETTADSFNFVLADGGKDGVAPVIGTFSLNVIPQNDIPVVVNLLGDRSTVVTQPFNFTVPATTFDDPDGDPLSLSASLANGAPLPSWLSFDPATGTFSGTPAKNDIGSLCLVVTADDGQGGQASDRFSLNVASLLALKEAYTNPDNGHIYFLTRAATWTDARAEAEEVDGDLRDPTGGWADVENDGPYYGEPVPGIVEVEPESLGYSLNGGSPACDAL